MTDTLRRLLLLRHAKSSWDDPSLADHDRPLAPRGHRAAGLIGDHLRANPVVVDLVLCSSARRARETLELAGIEGEVRIEPELYEASADELVSRVRELSDEVKAVMLIGHNPAMHELLLTLARDPGERVVRKFPTGALATLTFRGSWPELGPGDAELADLVRPRELDS